MLCHLETLNRTPIIEMFMSLGKEAEELTGILKSMISNDSRQELTNYFKGTGNDKKISDIMLTGYTTEQLLSLATALGEYLKTQYPDKSKELDAVKAELGKYFSNLGSADPGMLHIFFIFFPFIPLIVRPSPVPLPPRPTCFPFDFVCHLARWLGLPFP